MATSFRCEFWGTALVVLTGAGTWALVNSVVRGVSSITIPSISLPELPSLPNPLAQPVTDKNKTSNSEVLSRRQQLEIPETFFIQMADSLFYAQKPELKGRSLTSKPEDAPLRDEWHAVAGEFLNKIEQANLSTAVGENWEAIPKKIMKPGEDKHALDNWEITQPAN